MKEFYGLIIPLIGIVVTIALSACASFRQPPQVDEDIWYLHNTSNVEISNVKWTIKE